MVRLVVAGLVGSGGVSYGALRHVKASQGRQGSVGPVEVSCGSLWQVGFGWVWFGLAS